MYPPGLTFDEDVRDFPNMYLELRNYLKKRGANMPQRSCTGIIMMIDQILYDNAEDRAEAIEKANFIVS